MGIRSQVMCLSTTPLKRSKASNYHLSPLSSIVQTVVRQRVSGGGLLTRHLITYQRTGRVIPYVLIKLKGTQKKSFKRLARKALVYKEQWNYI